MALTLPNKNKGREELKMAENLMVVHTHTHTHTHKVI